MTRIYTLYRAGITCILRLCNHLSKLLAIRRTSRRVYHLFKADFTQIFNFIQNKNMFTKEKYSIPSACDDLALPRNTGWKPRAFMLLG
jgi:hypothetical protein